MRGGECPLLCCLLIPSHFGKISQREECVLGFQLLHILSITSDFGTEIHQQECGAVNVHSCSFCLSHHILGKYVTSWKTPATIACFAHHADPILLLSISRPMENQQENRHSSTSHCSHRNKGQTESFSKRRFNLYELMQLVKDTFTKIVNDVCSSSNSSWHVENSAHSCLHYSMASWQREVVPDAL
ncbi:Glutamyl-tRNA(Gln) amidotransferase subunit A [Trichinella pseudospiralis]